MRYFILVFFLMSCASSHHLVESDYSYEAKFHKYKTFDFATLEGFNGSDKESELIKKYIGNILTSWGYKQDSKKPDIYIYYSLFFEDLKLIGYNQQKLRNWSGLHGWYRKEIEQGDSLQRITADSIEEDHENTSNEDTYNPLTMQLTEGTLFISFFDRKKKLAAWQGYASGYFGKDGIKSERVLRSTVIKILDEFRLPSASS